MARYLSAISVCVICVALALLIAACGGSKKTPTQNKVDDPALVPSSTPIQNPPVFLITGNTIRSANGATATIAAGATVGGQSSSSQTYTVASGDTCSGIAAQSGVTLDSLEAANGGTNGTCSTLSVGDVMKIPAKATASATPGTGGAQTKTPSAGGSNATSTPTPSSGSGQTYTVQAGDTCYGIASSLGVDPDTFTQANANACNSLQAGDTLTVP